MTARPEEIVDKARQWVAHADDDLRVARHTLAMAEDCPYGVVAYHAQQCAEKYLKAYLVLRGVDFPYTHNIAHLLELCATDTDWAERLKDAAELTSYAVTARYPGIEEPVTEAEANRAMAIATSVCDVVRAALSPQGIE